MRKIKVELNENQSEMLDTLFELQKDELSESELNNLIFVAGLLLLFDKVVGALISLEESARISNVPIGLNVDELE